MKTVRIKEIRCPECQMTYNLAAHFGVAKQPQPGHFALCFFCGELLVFDQEMKAILPTSEQISELEKKVVWPHLVSAQAMIRQQRKNEGN